MDAAERAGALLRSRFQEEHAVRPKGDRGDVVTDLDLLAERLVVARIRESFPRDRSFVAGRPEAIGYLLGLVARARLTR